MSRSDSVAQFIRLSAEPTLLIDSGGVIARANAAVCKALGYSAQHLVGKPLAEFAIDGGDALRRVFAQCARSNEPTLTQLTLCDVQGSALRFPLRGIVLERSPRGAPLRYCLQMERNAEFAALNRTVSELAAKVQQRRRSEQRLDLAYQQLRATLDGLDALVYVADMATYEVLFVNRAGEQVWGDVTGKPCWQVLQVGQAGPCAFCTNPRLLRADGTAAGTVVWEHRSSFNGKWYECRDQAISWIDGRMVRLQVATDITERKISEEALRESQQRLFLLQFAVDHISDAVFLIGSDAHFSYVNQESCRRLGYTGEELLVLGVPDIDPLFPPERWPDHFAELRRAGTLTFESGHRTKNGKTIPVELTSSYFEYADIGYILAIARDITERKRAEEALRRANAYNRSLIEASVDPLVTIGTDGRITDVNAATEAVTGRTRTELIGTDFSDYFTEPGCAQAGYQQVFREGAVRDYALEIRHRDGHVTPVLYNASVYRDESGNVIGVFAAARDITERKVTELQLTRYREHLEELVVQRTQELEQTNTELKEEIEHRKQTELRLKESEEVLRGAKEAAEAANRAKSVFLANMSHELRTPMNAILGFAQLMQKDSSLSEEQCANVETIARSGHHLLTLINDVLEIAKIEAGKITAESHSFDLTELLDAIEEMIRLRAEKKGLALAVELHPRVPRYVKGDDKKLRQVLVNLLGNAVKFTSSGGIVLRVAPGTDTEEKIRFEVIDTGCGIAPADQERIFDAFYQTADASRRGEGTGLGLTISREYVELMGGTLTVESEPGKGAIFRFVIPLEMTPAVQIESAQRGRRVVALAPGQPSYRILIAEDRPDNRLLLRRLLEMVGFDVREAENGERALNLFHTWHPHLIWMDMRMPVMDGYEATRRIKATPEGRQTVVLALTASAFEEDRAEVLAAGCDGFLRKPLDVGEVFGAMADLLGVRYEYAEEGGPSQTAATVALDRDAFARARPELRAELRQAALALDVQQARSVIARLSGQVPELAAPLGRLVDDYRFDELLKLCDELP